VRDSRSQGGSEHSLWPVKCMCEGQRDAMGPVEKERGGGSREGTPPFVIPSGQLAQTEGALITRSLIALLPLVLIPGWLLELYC
jgi:hypothetical protein